MKFSSKTIVKVTYSTKSLPIHFEKINEKLSEKYKVCLVRQKRLAQNFHNVNMMDYIGWKS